MIPHGTASKYSNHACRCDACREAWRLYKKDYRRRTKYERNPATGRAHPRATA